jgi:uncharacterized membrane protein YbhN (UPF0104 family)
MSERTKKIYHSILLFLSLALLAGLAFYVHKNEQSFEKLKSINVFYIVFLISIHFLNYILLGLTHKLPLNKNNISLKFKEWFGLCMTGELFNMLLPAKGGTGIRMLYLKDKKGLSMREFLSMSFAIVLTGFTFLGISGTIYCEFFLKKNNAIFTILESVFIALSVSGIILIFASEAIGKLFKFQRKYTPKAYLADMNLTTKALLCWIGMFLIYPIKIYLSFRAIGVELNFTDSFEISLILLAASLFQVLPGNIGVKEIITAYIGKQYGLDFETALLASLIDRAILMMFLFPVGFYYYWQLFLGATLPTINFAKIGASSLIPLKKRLVKVR